MIDWTRSTPPHPLGFLPAAAPLEVFSDDMIDGERLADAQASGSISPSLRWSTGPEGTQSYAVTVFDPDAPTLGGIHHWVLVDIPKDVTELIAGSTGVGRPSLNDLGSLAYAGAAPPPGDRVHRYLFTVHALGVTSLPVDESTPASLVGFHLTINTLARGSLTALA
ncbi:YbhB/YbcL family Raf kinase inhibitor-like protein [Rathayibacter rathayi]|uniref:YbhB/YbcL family Raf kinase inhibitor-like protein n=1 Tax=Rathayibacter rathayi TaxID=33887 RepID=A0ABD6WCK7_RATRA|nr:YbhB/YbcL family Raf kinase inhibitor-like protein [Rathayibacter rathayi]AZZ50457.1 YbhB/YbcL family Raf kinase inhibitor-like protein [Rathayibacter rathayi]MWV73164.1 YbhB/YbcL family Raf kinase inhibitor-like protein [Rathayibacter rathayi NCPPB 2980 = VKM Ac-1601]PPF16452.1 YbhB/YbcL family Raf kinase inhibitor-like protein [Rathayibacter rathayi]PPF25533.1 YbhB/YbcL family Raf kinase inhibitor-like protein [Rathayibacter rathayi]PPF52045.1 YbhB/YbcL family Raf kinase inhibitor-like pr